MELASARASAKNLLSQRPHAAFTLDGFDQNRADIAGNLARRSHTSLKRTNSTPGTTGANGSRYFALCVVETDPKVRPWTLLEQPESFVPIAAPSLRPRPAYARASLSAPLPRFSAGVGKEAAVEAGALGQAQRELGLAFVIEEVRRVNERAALARNSRPIAG